MNLFIAAALVLLVLKFAGVVAISWTMLFLIGFLPLLVVAGIVLALGMFAGAAGIGLTVADRVRRNKRIRARS